MAHSALLLALYTPPHPFPPPPAFPPPPPLPPPLPFLHLSPSFTLVICPPGLLIANKWLISETGFRDTTLLTLLHMVTCMAASGLLMGAGLVPTKSMRWEGGREGGWAMQGEEVGRWGVWALEG